MQSITQYLQEIFLDNDKSLTRTQYLVMLSMLWALSSFFLVGGLSGIITSYFIAQKGTEYLAEHTVLMNVNYIFTSISLPWSFATFVTAFFCMHRMYNIQSFVIKMIMAFVAVIFFRILLMSSSLVSGEFQQVWAEVGSLPNLTEKLELLEKIGLIVFIVGLVFLLYPLKSLVKDQQNITPDKLGISRERFAKKILWLNGFLLFFSLTIVVLMKTNLMVANEFFVVLLLISILVSLYVIYLMWQRLKNANKSLVYLMYLLLSMMLAVLGVFIIWKMQNAFLLILAPYLISLGLNLPLFFICYLYLIPTVDKDTNIKI